jgi:hypothetical protein
MSPEEMIGKFVSFELMVKGSKHIVNLEQGTTFTPEVQPITLKATEEEKKESTPSRIPIDASKLDNEEMALIIKSFRQMELDNKEGGGDDDKDKEDEQEVQGQRPPHPRVHQAIQRDHPVNSILGDIHKGVTTRSRAAHFCEHYSFVSSIEPYRIEDALRDSDWVMAMQEELNNFTRNEVWHLVPCPNQNVVSTKWVFRNKQDEHGVVIRNKV